MIDPVEEISHGDGAFVLTCEHASERFPPGFGCPAEDLWLLGTHWAFDLGAADLCRELAADAQTSAVLSRFSRLLVDPNREPGHETLFRTIAEGRPVTLNVGITDEERERRMRELYAPYHEACARMVASSNAPLVLSMHTFTPLYEGNPRELEIGVLFDREEDLAQKLAAVFAGAGFIVRLNEPYSGKDGLMHSVDHHARGGNKAALELEVRQDLAVDAAFRARARAVLLDVLQA